MKISKQLLSILECPITKDKLLYDEENELLISPNVKLAFPVVNGIPMLLKDQAKKISDDKIKNLQKLKESLEIN